MSVSGVSLKRFEVVDPTAVGVPVAALDGLEVGQRILLHETPQRDAPRQCFLGPGLLRIDATSDLCACFAGQHACLGHINARVLAQLH